MRLCHCDLVGALVTAVQWRVLRISSPTLLLLLLLVLPLVLLLLLFASRAKREARRRLEGRPVTAERERAQLPDAVVPEVPEVYLMGGTS